MHDLDLASGGSGDLAIDIAMMTRVEGEGSLRLRVRNGVVEEAHLEIFEAPRYFEQLVVGRTPTRSSTSSPGSAASARSPTR